MFPRPDRAHDQFLTPTRRHLFVVSSHSAWTFDGRAANQSACRHERYHVRVAKAVRTDSIWAVIGGVIVAPRASELIFPLALAVEHRLTVDQVARAFTVYPSLSGSISEAARAMHIVL